MALYLAVAIGGAIGAVSRYWLMNSIAAMAGMRFPWGTLTVNLIGSLLIGIGFVLLTERGNAGELWRPLLVVGFLGAFTTFSTFSLDTLQLLVQGQPVQAIAYTLGSVVFCIALTWLGMSVSRALF